MQPDSILKRGVGMRVKKENRESGNNALLKLITVTSALLIVSVGFFSCAPRFSLEDDAHFLPAAENGHRAAEGFERCQRFVDGWLAHADSATVLRTLSKCGGNSLPLFSTRRNIPLQAFPVK